jgi:hypothetical protein
MTNILIKLIFFMGKIALQVYGKNTLCLSIQRTYDLSATLNVILNSVPGAPLSSILPSNWSTRMFTNCSPSDSRLSSSMFSGNPFPLSEIVKLKRDLCISLFFSSLQSRIRIFPSLFSVNACLRELETSSLTIIPSVATI